MKSPIYLFWTVLCLGYLGMANLRGWSLLHTLSPSRLFPNFSNSSGFNHK